MKGGVPRETAPGEHRVALVPESVKRLTGTGFEIELERGAGEAASFLDPARTGAGAKLEREPGAEEAPSSLDPAYEEAGATLVDDPYSADAIAKVQTPSTEEVERLRDGQVLIGFLQPLTDREGIDRLAE